MTSPSAPPPKCPRQDAPSPSAPLYDTIVTVKVGPQKREFYAHKGLICHYSTYFKAAFNGQFREGATGVMELAKDSVEVFKVFFSWMYTHKLFEPLPEPGKLPLTSQLLSEVYVFGDARGVPALKDAVINTLIDKIAIEWTVPTVCIPYIYDNTPESSPLRKLVVDIVVMTNGSIAHLREPTIRPRFTKEYLLDLALALSELSTGLPSMTRDQWLNIDRCKYHDHSTVAATSDTT